MKNLVLAISAMVLFLIAGCTGESWMTENGGTASADAGAGAGSYDAGHDHGQSADVSASCTPQCTGKNCGDNGCGGTCGACEGDENCSATGLCVPKTSSAHACTKGGACDTGERCWCDANGKFTCYTLTGLCVNNAAGGGEVCESTSSTTGMCATGSSCVGADMSPKSGMCSTPAGRSGGNGTCVVRQLDGMGFTAFGNGVSSLEMAEAGWSQPVTAAPNAGATLTVGGASYFSFNAQRSDGLWAFGWDGVSASQTTKVVGNWSIDCGGKVTKVINGPQQANCGSSLSVGSTCFWSKPGTAGTYRILVRFK